MIEKAGDDFQIEVFLKGIQSKGGYSSGTMGILVNPEDINTEDDEILEIEINKKKINSVMYYDGRLFVPYNEVLMIARVYGRKM